MDHASNKIYKHLSEISRNCKPIVASKYLFAPPGIPPGRCLNTKCDQLGPVPSSHCLLHHLHSSLQAIGLKFQQFTNTIPKIDISLKHLWLEDEISYWNGLFLVILSYLYIYIFFFVKTHEDRVPFANPTPRYPLPALPRFILSLQRWKVIRNYRKRWTKNYEHLRFDEFMNFISFEPFFGGFHPSKNAGLKSHPSNINLCVFLGFLGSAKTMLRSKLLAVMKPVPCASSAASRGPHPGMTYC